jgi:hypothetical protein
MRSAAELRNAEALAEHVDFPSLRQSLKDQLNVVVMSAMAKEEGDSFAALGAVFAGAMIEGLVDAMITPSGLRQMMAGQDVSPGAEPTDEGDVAKPFEGASGAYDSFSRFVITVPAEDGNSSQFILRRDGLSWKLTEILITLPELN